jgi:hypothetical protein
MRARKRWLTLFSASVIATLTVVTGCSSSTNGTIQELEKRGYVNVKSATSEGEMRIYTATVNHCTVDLYKTADKEVWNAMIAVTPDGKPVAELPRPETGWTFLQVNNARTLQENPRFTAICPP